ncbi:anti-repressor Ant [Mycobacterium phage Anthony]|uniref:Antirepressor n=1 Tax=Mycobacterium phage Anthony TaxID=2599857 RepID=A0A5J6TI32_9CAUD|nr:anti-repressor Ant [Mycobacterium phage Anthony]QFG10440.1 antirepressor [Mycobacterium phage Anthony]
MSEIEIFKFQDRAPVRTVIRDGEPWFVAKDICDELGTSTGNLAAILDADERGTYSVGTGFDQRRYAIVNESGLYSLILRSRKPEAKAFKKWITSEVLPTIRKTGGAYIKPGSQAELDLTNPDTALEKLAEVIQIAQAARAEAAALTAARDADAPYVKASQEFFDYSGGDLATTTDAARMLSVPPYTFRDYLRQWGWITEVGCAARAYAVTQGYAENKIFILPDSGRAQNTAKLTRKGIERAAIKLKEAGYWPGPKALQSA